MSQIFHKPILCSLRLHSWRFDEHESGVWQDYARCARCGVQLSWPTKSALDMDRQNNKRGVSEGTGWLNGILKNAGKVIER